MYSVVRHRVRTGLSWLFALILLVGAGPLWPGWVGAAAVYVGVNGNQLAIYHGWRGSVLGNPAS